MWQNPFTLHQLLVSCCVIGCYVINYSKSPFTTLHRPSSFFAVFSLFLAWIDGFFVLFEIWLIMKNIYIFPFKSDEKNCIMDL